MKLLLFKFCVIEVAIFSKDHDLIFLRAQGGSQMDWFAAIAAGYVPQSLVSFLPEAVTQIQSSTFRPLTGFR